MQSLHFMQRYGHVCHRPIVAARHFWHSSAARAAAAGEASSASSTTQGKKRVVFLGTPEVIEKGSLYISQHLHAAIGAAVELQSAMLLHLQVAAIVLQELLAAAKLDTSSFEVSALCFWGLCEAQCIQSATIQHCGLASNGSKGSRAMQIRSATHWPAGWPEGHSSFS